MPFHPIRDPSFKQVRPPEGPLPRVVSRGVSLCLDVFARKGVTRRRLQRVYDSTLAHDLFRNHLLGELMHLELIPSGVSIHRWWRPEYAQQPEVVRAYRKSLGWELLSISYILNSRGFE